MAKKLYTLIITLICAISVFSQAPEGFTYQAVVRNPDGTLITNTEIGLKITLLAGSTSGTEVCIEEFTKTTNNFGLVTLEIGSVNSTDFGAIDWSANEYFVKVEIDPAGGTSYTEMGTSQLLSVPYALHAKTAESVPITGNEPAFDGWDKDEEELWSTQGSSLYYEDGNVGIGMNTPDRILTINSGGTNSYIGYRNTNTGTTSSDGFISGISTGGHAYLWNYENGDIRIGTNNSTSMVVSNTGDIGIGTSSPHTKLDVNGDAKFGTNGVAFSELREITGTTHSTDYWTSIALPTGYTEDNTRILNAQVNYNSDRWVGLGYHSGTAGDRSIGTLINGSYLYLYCPDISYLKSKDYRITLMRVD